MQESGIIRLKSPYTVAETVRRLENILRAKGLTIFCRVDHSGEAERIGLKMPPTQLIIFGSPKAGTPLMVASPLLALDLPLKALIAQDNSGDVWLSYNATEYLQQRHNIPNDLINNISGIGPLMRSVVQVDAENQKTA
jgi:uncharacterized protein (DUF302 family)